MLETWTVAWHQRDEFRCSEHLVQWLHVVARNKAISATRSEAARRRAHRRLWVQRRARQADAEVVESGGPEVGSLLAESSLLHSAEVRFRFVVLIDDFAGSGTTLLRTEDDGSWDGKLMRFFDHLKRERKETFARPCSVLVHHYVATKKAVDAANIRHSAAQSTLEDWFEDLSFSWGTVLPESLEVRAETGPEFCRLIERYYDPDVETESLRKGGKTAMYGFSDCRLPLILEHNTPNNSVAILWAETEGLGESPAMRPLFRRRQRHF